MTFVLDFFPTMLLRQLEITKPETYSFRGNYSNANSGMVISAYDVGSALTFLDRHKKENIYNYDLSKSVQYYGRGTLENRSSSSAEFITEKYGDYSYVGQTLGFGETTWVDGTFHEGYYLSGTRGKAGYGEVIYGNDDNRETYKGMWWDDKKNGYGLLKYKDGKIEKGVFKDNVFKKSENFDFELMQKTFKNWY